MIGRHDQIDPTPDRVLIEAIADHKQSYGSCISIGYSIYCRYVYGIGLCMFLTAPRNRILVIARIKILVICA